MHSPRGANEIHNHNLFMASGQVTPSRWLAEGPAKSRPLLEFSVTEKGPAWLGQTEI